ncbi:MAG: DUF2953 domain-containing protein [Senegalia sp. (in: firmicutes)]
MKNKNKTLELNYIIQYIKDLINKNAYKIFIINICKKITIKDLTLNTKIGYKDAHITAICYGILQILKSNIIYYLNSKFNIINYNYFVNTIYNANIFEFEYKIVVKIKIFHVIESILITLLKLKEGE